MTAIKEVELVPPSDIQSIPLVLPSQPPLSLEDRVMNANDAVSWVEVFQESVPIGPLDIVYRLIYDNHNVTGEVLEAYFTQPHIRQQYMLQMEESLIRLIELCLRDDIDNVSGKNGSETEGSQQRLSQSQRYKLAFDIYFLSYCHLPEPLDSDTPMVNFKVFKKESNDSTVVAASEVESKEVPTEEQGIVSSASNNYLHLKQFQLLIPLLSHHLFTNQTNETTTLLEIENDYLQIIDNFNYICVRLVACPPPMLYLAAKGDMDLIRNVFAFVIRYIHNQFSYEDSFFVLSKALKTNRFFKGRVDASLIKPMESLDWLDLNMVKEILTSPIHDDPAIKRAMIDIMSGQKNDTQTSEGLSGIDSDTESVSLEEQRESILLDLQEQSIRLLRVPYNEILYELTSYYPDFVNDMNRDSSNELNVKVNNRYVLPPLSISEEEKDSTGEKDKEEDVLIGVRDRLSRLTLFTTQFMEQYTKYMNQRVLTNSFDDNIVVGDNSSSMVCLNSNEDSPWSENICQGYINDLNNILHYYHKRLNEKVLQDDDSDDVTSLLQIVYIFQRITVSCILFACLYMIDLLSLSLSCS